jgi:hypothetical protein
MAQGLSKKHSPVRVADGSRRARRQGKRTKNAKAIEQLSRLEEPEATLNAKIKASDDAATAEADAFDDWVADDQEVDAHVESASRKAKDYDADHPGMHTHAVIFHDQRPSAVTGTNRAEQPNTITKLVERMGALPPEHPALPIVPLLVESNDRTRQSQQAHALAVTARTEADAATEVAKLALIQVYRDVIIDTTRAVGEALAERCFPRVSAPKKKKKVEDTEEDDAGV